MTQLLFRNFQMLDPEHDELRGGYELLVEADKIKEVSEKPIKASDAASSTAAGAPSCRA